MFHVIVFETTDGVKTADLHEALCQACHEEEGLTTLSKWVEDVQTFDDFLKNVTIPR